ncbi:MAG: extracellular matrix regulator RemB [Faecousia sp.]
MYLSIGADFAVRQDAILGIFDLDNASWSRHTRAFLREAEQQGQVVAVTDELPKSFLLTEEFGLERVYLTQLSSAALEKRCERAFDPAPQRNNE